jgi:hypothetical protein
MKARLLTALAVGALAVGGLGICPLASAQENPATPGLAQSQTPIAQPTPSPQMQGMPGMDKMSDSVTKMSEMCMAMMEKENAMMPFIASISAIFGVLLFIALFLLVVLEIQWIKYWSRILKQGKNTSG